ncbi:MAG: hypothetical protein MR350_03920 [Alphaproteobacteria bacterium]|nr:hypothetical protein [Alphaproteobacteria bacterium]
MKKLIVMLGVLACLLSACDNSSKEPEKTPAATTEPQVQNTEAAVQSSELWTNINGEPANFEEAFNQLNDVQKYYFCAAFSVGAMSVSKPETASAMVNYFLGLGVAKYNQGIDDSTYSAFDSGKHIFRYELVVNDILDKKICENIVLEATKFAQEKNLSVESLNDLGKPEVEKIVEKLK